MDLGDFLVTGYVCTSTGGWSPAYPLVFLWWFVRFIFFYLMSPVFPLGFFGGFLSDYQIISAKALRIFA